MKLSPDSPELTAYALDELAPADRATLEAALAEAPELRAELAALRETAATLSAEFATEPAVELSAAQRAAIVRNAGPVLPASRPRRSEPSPWSRFLNWRNAFVWVTAAVGVVTLALVLFRPSRPVELAFNDLRYQPGHAEPSEATGLARNLPVALTESAVKTAALATDRVEVLSARIKPAESELTLAKREATASQPNLALGLSASATVSPAAPELATVAGESAVNRFGLDAAVVPEVNSTRSMGRREMPVARFKQGATVTRDRGDQSASGAPALGGLAYTPAPTAQYQYAPAGEVRQLQESELPYQASGAAGRIPAQTWAYGESRRGEQVPRLLSREAGQQVRFLDAPAAATAETYAPVADNPFKDVTAAPLSTFGMDVDTGSYSNIRRFLRDGSLPPADAVRLEELINYFHYDYPAPHGDDPFRATVEIATCPWNEAHKLVRLGVKAREIPRGERPRANLVFLLDVSGSMEPEARLPLVKRAMRLLLDRLTPRDTVGIVTYAGEARVALEPVALGPDSKQRVTDVLEGLRAGHGTHGSAGIQNAYAMATNHFVKDGVNRVILCTDGDFNIGITDQSELLNLITREAKSGVFLSVLGFGMDNLKDATMETLADKGNGAYAYIDSFSEARKILVEQLDGTLVTVAKDAKVQVEFNPARVASWRLLGYEKRLLRDRDFNDDTKDAGEVGAGHTVTVLYEIVPTPPNLAGVDPLRYAEKPGASVGHRETVKPVHTDELLNLKLRYKQPDGGKSRLIEQPVKDSDRELAEAGVDFKFAAAVAGYGMLLRDSPHKGDLTWEKVLRLAEQGQGDDAAGYRAEFIDLVRKAQKLSGGK